MQLKGNFQPTVRRALIYCRENAPNVSIAKLSCNAGLAPCLGMAGSPVTVAS